MTFEELVGQACTTSFVGWDWSAFEGRFVETPAPWDEREMVRARLEDAGSLLDLGTGGGERLSQFVGLPTDTVATEGYEPNVPVARRRLAPLGVDVVVTADDLRLPLDDARFDVVVARHEAFDAIEVARVLAPGGVFITQQVGGRDLAELNEVFDRPTTFAGWDLGAARSEVEAAGLEVLDAQEAWLPARFRDVGAVVLFCRITPWQVPGFSVTDDEAALRTIHATIERDGAFEVHTHRFVIEARRPS